MSDKILISNDNVKSIITSIYNDIKTRISNKDISLPYTNQLSKSTFIKVDGDGSMYLSNNGNYVSLGNINKSNLDITKIYEIFNIASQIEHWDSTGIVNMPTARQALTSQVYNGKIYCIGGTNTNGANVNNVDIYDIANNSWTTGTPMPTARHALTSVLYNGKIYCIGGTNDNILNIIEIYDIANNSWTTGKSMPTARYDLTSALYNGKIYCIGGYPITNIVEIYDIANNSWTTGNSLPTARYGLTSQVYNGKIYCIGGRSGNINLNTVEIYDIANNTWTTGKSMPTARYNLTSALYNGKIYCIGGYISSVTNNVDIYDIANNSWTTGAPMPTARVYLTSSIYNNKIYCIGGINSRGILNIVEVYYLPYTTYSITLPDIINNKLSKIIINGDGTKVLRNDGSYKAIIPTYVTMDNNEITNYLANLTGGV